MLFVYGTLLQGEPRNRYLKDCKLCSVAQIPGRLFDTKKGYPTAVFDSNSKDTVMGELYKMGNPRSILSKVDSIECVDEGLFTRAYLKLAGKDIITYAAGENLIGSLKESNRIKDGDWRRHYSTAHSDPIEFAINFESKLKETYKIPTCGDCNGLIYIKGDKPVLVTAPHACAHVRMGKLKRQEFYTGVLSVLLHVFTGCHVLYANRLTGIDPNYYDDAPFKSKLANVLSTYDINFVIDLHGTGTERQYGIYPGIGQAGEFLLGKCEALSELRKRSLINEIDLGGLEVFPASKQMTVAKFVARNFSVPSMQLEINRALRQPETNPGDFNKLLDLLCGYVSFLESI